jgi:uncharacterized membrane protein YphA (DoxX/SURF4 family)
MTVCAWQFYLPTLARLVLCERFLYEFYDKIARYSYWRDQIATKFGSAASFLLVIIISLLFFGTSAGVCGPLLLSSASPWRRRAIIGGALALLVFQLPATIMYEQGGYEISSTVSILGGLLLATWTSLSTSS